MQAEGPYSDWLGGAAGGQTFVHFNHHGGTVSVDWGCAIVVESDPAVTVTFDIVLPSWTVPTSADAGTIPWWNGYLSHIATHEKVHVDINRNAAQRASQAMASSTCETLRGNLDAVWADALRLDCEFDMKEYGTSTGLSLAACLAG